MSKNKRIDLITWVLWQVPYVKDLAIQKSYDEVNTYYTGRSELARKILHSSVESAFYQNTNSLAQIKELVIENLAYSSNLIEEHESAII